MTTRSAFFVQTYYSGTVAEKLAWARALYARHALDLKASALFQEQLDRLQLQTLALNGYMQSTGVNRLCSHCATHPDGGCCSAFMADNTDSILLLINLLLNIKVQYRNQVDENCCFLGDQGCFFLVKPIFCLNYNCTHILESGDTESLNGLYRLAAAVLSQQTRVETLLLEALTRHDRIIELKDPPIPDPIS